MKAHYLLPAIVGGLLLIPSDTQAQGRPGGQSNIRELFLKQFDKNGDGKIGENERPSREQIQEFFRKQQGNQTAPGRPGAGGSGQNRPGGPGQGRPGGPGQGGGGGRPGGPGQGDRPGFGGPGQGGFPGGPGGQPPHSPLAMALDTDRDGVISASELKNASKSLSKLDRNGDGKITRDELHQRQPGGQGGRPGQGDRPGFGNPGQGRPDEFRRPGNPGQGRPDGFRRPGNPGQGRPDGPTNPRGPRPGRSEA